MGAAGWIEAAIEAIPRLAACRYFDSPVTLIQFTRPGFVQKVLGGQYDAGRTQKGGAARIDGDKPAPLEGWSEEQIKGLEHAQRRQATGGAA